MKLVHIMYKSCLKRVLDIVLGLLLMPFFIALAIPVAIMIKLESGGPVFFRQRRGGRNGAYFEILKFRTMSSCPDSERKEFEPGEKKRITRFGALLRRSKLDETPQIINVILGDMSFVGPRPEVGKYIEVYPDRWARILSVRPGVTDPASVEFRNEEEILASAADPERKYIEEVMPLKLSLYEKYISQISFLGDMEVIAKTIFSVLLK